MKPFRYHAPLHPGEREVVLSRVGTALEVTMVVYPREPETPWHLRQGRPFRYYGEEDATPAEREGHA